MRVCAVHIGGDETDPQCWGRSETVRIWASQQGLSLHQLQAHFNGRIFATLKSMGKIALGWDEILRGMSRSDDESAIDSVVVQSWTGPEGVNVGTQRGYRMLRSHGYYLDHLEPAAKHHEIDPAEWYAGRERPAALQSPSESAGDGKVLGGEACAWSEYMDRNNYLGRVFPRLAAVAERLWTRDLSGSVFPADAYFATAWYLERMEIVPVEREHDAAVERLFATAEGVSAGEEQVAEGLACVASLVEPLRIGDRASKRKWDEKGWGARGSSTRNLPLLAMYGSVIERLLAREYSGVDAAHAADNAGGPGADRQLGGARARDGAGTTV